MDLQLQILFTDTAQHRVIAPGFSSEICEPKFQEIEKVMNLQRTI
jgi:hypothetical protein